MISIIVLETIKIIGVLIVAFLLIVVMVLFMLDYLDDIVEGSITIETKSTRPVIIIDSMDADE